MKDGPEIARVASLIGDPARANMLTAMVGGQALTTSELSGVAGVSLPTASSHLAKLEDAKLVVVERQGRHRYYRLADGDVAHVLESLMGIAARSGITRVRTGPKEPKLRRARVCYDHLAGDLGVQMFDSFEQRGFFDLTEDAVTLTTEGEAFLEQFEIDLKSLRRRRRPLCRACLDWSVRRHHLAGALGAALLDRFYHLGWARREKDSRIVLFTSEGDRAFNWAFTIT
ncbi:MAG: ArsR/SmtB family transcription factor [Geminicoccaceae bacterium]